MGFGVGSGTGVPCSALQDQGLHFESHLVRGAQLIESSSHRPQRSALSAEIPTLSATTPGVNALTPRSTRQSNDTEQHSKNHATRCGTRLACIACIRLACVLPGKFRASKLLAYVLPGKFRAMFIFNSCNQPLDIRETGPIMNTCS